MRRFAQISLMLVTLVACLPPGGDLWAKHGRSGSKGGGSKSYNGGSSFHGGGSSRSSAGPTHRGRTKPAFTTKHDATKHKLKDGDQPWTKHQAREQRKLEHRQRVADHLREVSDRNGNEHLKQVADDMDERAQAHYDKQLRKFNHKYGPDGTVPDADEPEHVDDETFDDSREFFKGTNEDVDELARKLTGRENAAARQLRNETRQLTRRMEAVERLRTLGEETGNERMLQEADRLEQQALDHFQNRMEKITEFRQRHGLSEIQHHHAP